MQVVAAIQTGSSLRVRASAVVVGLTTILIAVVVVTTAVPATSAVAGGASRDAGEEWYGSVSWQGIGTVQTCGGTYVNRDLHTMNAPKSSDMGTLTSSVDTTLTCPDPDPNTDGCWAETQTWQGGAVVPAYFTVSTQGSFYELDVSASAAVTVTKEVKYGGMIGGEACSLGDTIETVVYYPFGFINSSQRAETNFRGGSQVSKSREGIGNCPATECTDILAFEHLPAVQSQWNIHRKGCTGYSKSHRLGKQDTLFVFTACQTKSLSSRVNFLQEISGEPAVCQYVFVSKLSKACKAYAAVRRVQWAQVDWFFSNAANNDACGVWVVDRARWRPPVIKPATRPSDSLAIAWISRGESQRVESAEGSVQVSCPL